MPRLIRLSGGQETLVDDEDVYLSELKWYLHDRGYAVRKPRGSSVIYMLRVILSCPDGYEIDHIDRNPLNNTRENLRVVPHWLNMQNRGKQKNNTTGFKGVFLDKRRQKWYAMKRVNGKVIFLGSYSTAEAASKAYESF